MNSVFLGFFNPPFVTNGQIKTRNKLLHCWPFSIRNGLENKQPKFQIRSKTPVCGLIDANLFLSVSLYFLHVSDLFGIENPMDYCLPEPCVMKIELTGFSCIHVREQRKSKDILHNFLRPRLGNFACALN